MIYNVYNAHAVHTYIPFRGNFQVALAKTTAKTTFGVFQMLENVCKDILHNRSSKPHYHKLKSGERVEKTPIAEKMFWSKCYMFVYICTFDYREYTIIRHMTELRDTCLH